MKKFHRVYFECDHDCTSSCDEEYCDIRINIGASYHTETPEEAIKLCEMDYDAWNCDVYDYVIEDEYRSPAKT